MKRSRLFLLVACLFSTVRAEPEAATAVAEDSPQFIRVEETGDATRLQTAVVKFTKDGASVELVGAIHIADKKYYEALNKRFESYEAVLYEGIGGGKPAPAAVPDKVPDGEESPAAPQMEEAGAAAPKKANLEGLHGAYEAGARWLGLSYQMKEIDYRKANFVHADLTLEEFATLQAERKESVLSFMLKAGLHADRKAVKEPSSIKMLTSIIKGNKNGLKRELVHSLGAGDDQVSSLAGENVIIGDRNAKCLQVLDSEVSAGKKNLCIFYGAAHFPDMEQRLLEQGWEKTGAGWMTAWDIPE